MEGQEGSERTGCENTHLVLKVKAHARQSVILL